MVDTTRLDVLIFGGGAAGLWTLDRLARAGYAVVLLESRSLGQGQTVQSQGIIHGGGKYALHGLSDLASVATIKEMPDRWRAHMRRERAPNLSAMRLLSEQCVLWLPRESFFARVASFGFVPMLGKTGLLATPPVAMKKEEWPQALQDSAIDVYAMAEPVIDTMSFLEAIAAPNRDRIRSYEAGAEAAGVSIRSDGLVKLASPRIEIQARSVVLAAGSGNGPLFARVGIDPWIMQERPLRMFLLRGDLPPLFGHCVIGGKPHVTITSTTDSAGRTVWNVGGEVAEQATQLTDDEEIRRAGAKDLRRCLPGFDFSKVEMAHYPAQRAESRTKDLRRPSGVHANRLADKLWVAWPTKLALAPVLADELFEQLSVELGPPAGYPIEPFGGACPPVASPPWEQAAWSPVP